VIRGKWWEMFNDAQLNSLEDQLSTANQNIALADANFRVARALIKESRSQYFPTVTTSPSIIVSRQSGAHSLQRFSRAPEHNYTLPFDATWEPDFWGRIRNTVVASTSEAQASAADLQKRAVERRSRARI
jgi:outer membrane protein TolC